MIAALSSIQGVLKCIHDPPCIKHAPAPWRHLKVDRLSIECTETCGYVHIRSSSDSGTPDQVFLGIKTDEESNPNRVQAWFYRFSGVLEVSGKCRGGLYVGYGLWYKDFKGKLEPYLE